MKQFLQYLQLFWYLAINWNLKLAVIYMFYEIRGEKKYGIRTSHPLELENLTIDKGNISRSSRYEAVNYFILEQLLKKFRTISHETNITDIGCGKGRVLCVAACYGFTEITGIDFAQELCAWAWRNISGLEAKYPGARFNVFCMDVLDYPIRPDQNVFFLFNPFEKEVIDKWLNRLENSLDEYPRTVYILYASPKHIETFYDFGYEVNYRVKKAKYLEGVILRKPG